MAGFGRRRGLAGAVAALLAALAAVIAIVSGSGESGGTLRATFATAINVIPGQEVRLAGVKIGEVGTVEFEDGQAVVELDVAGDVWPLPRGTTARLRYGSTVSYAARFVELDPGPESAPPLADGAVLTHPDVVTPVEFDEIFNMFDDRTRRNLSRLLNNGGATFGGRADSLARALEDSPGGLDATASVLREVGADRTALETLVRAGQRTSTALARRDARLRTLVSTAAQTFDEFAEHERAIRASLDRFAPTLRTTRVTMAHLDRTLVDLELLTRDMAPGARELTKIATPSLTAIRTLDAVAPLATSTLRQTRVAAPDIVRLLEAGSPFARKLRPVLEGAEPAVRCLRPYGPEMAGTLGTWAAFAKNYDKKNHYLRILTENLPYSNGTQLNSEQVVMANPGVIYAFPRAPGLGVDEPWFQPECGVGRESLDPRRDPERVDAG